VRQAGRQAVGKRTTIRNHYRISVAHAHAYNICRRNKGVDE
jgi:hypothetical protein